MRLGTAVDRFKSEALNDFDAGYCQLHLANSADDEVRNTANALLCGALHAFADIFKAGEWKPSMAQLHVLVPRAILSCAMPFCRICWRSFRGSLLP